MPEDVVTSFPEPEAPSGWELCVPEVLLPGPEVPELLPEVLQELDVPVEPPGPTVDPD